MTTRPDLEASRVRIYPGGPMLVSGLDRITEPDGTTTEVTRRTVALCRCGRSRVAPFCDGSHKVVGYAAPGDGTWD